MWNQYYIKSVNKLYLFLLIFKRKKSKKLYLWSFCRLIYGGHRDTYKNRKYKT